MQVRSFAFLRMTVLAALWGPTLALAQVGHSPSGSPFRDIRKGHTLTAIGGYFGGSGGQFNIGPHKGAVFGGRYDIRTRLTGTSVAVIGPRSVSSSSSRSRVGWASARIASGSPSRSRGCSPAASGRSVRGARDLKSRLRTHWTPRATVRRVHSRR